MPLRCSWAADVQSVTRAPGTALESPSGEFPLGTDQFGRSLLGLLMWGSRISLTVGLLAATLSVAIGTLVGIVAGHYGGWFSTVTMRVTDWFLVMPTLVLAIVLATVMSRSVGTNRKGKRRCNGSQGAGSPSPGALPA